jgi:hypothetical protein
MYLGSPAGADGEPLYLPCRALLMRFEMLLPVCKMLETPCYLPTSKLGPLAQLRLSTIPSW